MALVLSSLLISNLLTICNHLFGSWVKQVVQAENLQWNSSLGTNWGSIWVLMHIGILSFKQELTLTNSRFHTICWGKYNTLHPEKASSRCPHSHLHIILLCLWQMVVWADYNLAPTCSIHTKSLHAAIGTDIYHMKPKIYHNNQQCICLDIFIRLFVTRKYSIPIHSLQLAFRFFTWDYFQ